MDYCEVCGNGYEKPMKIMLGGRQYTFDCFECAIHALAPSCEACGLGILGHGVETNGKMYCSNHCASQMNFQKAQ